MTLYIPYKLRSFTKTWHTSAIVEFFIMGKNAPISEKIGSPSSLKGCFVSLSDKHGHFHSSSNILGDGRSQIVIYARI